MMLGSSLGFSVVDDLGKYLGVPLVHHRITNSTYTNLLEKVKTRLSSWNGLNLSLAGRITLTNTVLEALPIYSMQTARIPRSVLDDIEKHCRKFIWSGTREDKKLSLVSWKGLCAPKNRGGLGLKKLREMNDALIMKLVWYLTTDSSALWCKVMKSKYGVNLGGLPEVLKHKNGSHVWRAICSVWSLMRGGFKWVIGNGCKVRFWLDSWAADKPLVAFLLNEFDGDLQESVCNFVDEEGRWNWSLFAHLLPYSCILSIAAIKPPCEQGGEDKLIWAHTKSGSFTVKSAYQFILAEEWNEEDSAWGVVWKWRGPQRIKVFLWLALKGRLLTRSEMCRRHLLPDDTCERCGQASETLIHVLRDCFIAKQTWLQLVPLNSRREFFSMPLREWLLGNLQNKLQVSSNPKWEHTFAVGVWRLWHWRNEEIFKGAVSHEVRKSQDIRDRALELEKLPAMQRSLQSQSGMRVSQIRWFVPAAPFVKVNTDGAVDTSNSIASAGGLIRDQHGAWQGGFAFKIGCCDVLGAELWGFLKGLELAWSLNFRNIVIETDSTMVLKNVTMNVEEATAQGPLIRAIKGMLRRDWQVEVRHVYREANQAADRLAKHARTLSLGSYYFEKPPDFLLSRLEADREGSYLPRVLNC